MNTSKLTSAAAAAAGTVGDAAYNITDRAPDIAREVGHSVGEAARGIAELLPFVQHQPPPRRPLRLWLVPAAVIAVVVSVLWWTSRRIDEPESQQEPPDERLVDDRRLFSAAGA